jgi:hypothetical protein
MPAADRNMRAIMDNERITDADVVKAMFHELLQCVKYMHERGWIHGDLKPRNIMRIIRELVRRIMLIDLDASAAIGVQYSWSKHSSAYMTPEAVCLPHSRRRGRFAQLYERRGPRHHRHGQGRVGCRQPPLQNGGRVQRRPDGSWLYERALGACGEHAAPGARREQGQPGQVHRDHQEPHERRRGEAAKAGFAVHSCISRHRTAHAVAS